jgi:uncharacterized membrane protein
MSITDGFGLVCAVGAYLGKFDRLDNMRFRMCETQSLQVLLD